MSWIKRSRPDDVPSLLTFGTTVYVQDERVAIDQITGRDYDDWALEIKDLQTGDTGSYECQISTEPPQIHRMHLTVESKTMS